MHKFSQLLNWTAGISVTSKFLEMDLNLESKQNLDLNLQYPESHQMRHFWFPCLAEKIIIILSILY